MKKVFGFIMAIAILFACCIEDINASEIGKVTAVKRMIDGNDVIVANAIDDPQNPFITCYVSSVTSGKVFAMADPSNASISCRQMKPIGNMSINTSENHSIFEKKKSILTKTQKIARFYDEQRNAFVYIVYTTKMYGGSVKNSISVVPLSE